MRICAFYHLIGFDDLLSRVYSPLSNLSQLIKEFFVGKTIKGTILVAPEGLNGTVSGFDSEIQQMLDFFCEILLAKELFEIKYSECDFSPFSKLKILARDEVVSLKSDLLLDETLRAKDVDSNEWDEFISNNDVQILDVRNGYEYRLGTFKKALNFDTVNFREFKLKLKDALNSGVLDLNKKTAIFCQGDIRCEKGGVYMRNMGFRNVFKLKGGILRYFEKTRNVNKSWEGDCFIFDDRVTLDENLNPGKLRCIHCLKIIETVIERRSSTKGRVICGECKIKRLNADSL